MFFFGLFGNGYLPSTKHLETYLKLLISCFNCTCDEIGHPIVNLMESQWKLRQLIKTHNLFYLQKIVIFNIYHVFTPFVISSAYVIFLIFLIKTQFSCRLAQEKDSQIISDDFDLCEDFSTLFEYSVRSLNIRPDEYYLCDIIK